MTSAQLTAMNGYLSQNYPGLYRRAYKRTSYCGYSVTERQLKLIEYTVGDDTPMLAAAFRAAGIK